MTQNARRILRPLFVAAVLWLAGTVQVQAYCVANRADTPIHVQALDSAAWVTDLAPGETVCNDADRPTKILALTEYRPPSAVDRAGWTAECRGMVSPQGEIVIEGSRKKIACKAN